MILDDMQDGQAVQLTGVQSSKEDNYAYISTLLDLIILLR